MPSIKARRPSLRSSMLWYLPVLVLVVVAIYLAHPLVLIPLLVANALAMVATCHALGLDAEADYLHTALRRGAAWLLLFTAYTALTWLLVALPMISLTTHPSLAGALMLSVALAIAVAFLWRAWPAFGLLFLWDDAFPPRNQGSWLLAAVARSLSFARHLAAEERFFTHFLPSALATMVMALGALLLSGLYDVWPSELRTAALWLYGLLILPAACLTIANRSLRALFSDHPPHAGKSVPEPVASAALTELPRDTLPTISLSAAESAPEQRDAHLLAAIRAADVPRALALLEAGANPDILPEPNDADQRSPLAHAALLPDTRLLRALIAHGADINRSHRGMTALLIATRDGGSHRAEAVMVLLANGADPSATDSEGNTPLHHAARSGDLDTAADLLGSEAPINARNQRGLTPLACAAHATHWPMLDWLLEHKAQTEVTGAEPALLAAAGIAEDDPEGVRRLLAHKAKVNVGNALGRTALMTAALEGHTRIVRALLDARAAVDAADQHGTTALMEAARTGADAVLEALCEAGADPAPRDRHGRDALMLACLSPRASTDTVARLMAAGADPRAGDPQGRSALDCARDAGRWDLLQVLDPETELPASIAATRSPDPDAATPEHLCEALRYGHWAIVSSFTSLIHEWPQSVRAGLYLDLAESGLERARGWLARNGLHHDVRLEDGRRLFDALLDTLPDGHQAVRERLQAGVSPAGRGLPAKAMLESGAPGASGSALILSMLDGGADPFGGLPDGRTPVHLAAAGAWEGVLERLLALGVDVNARDHEGRTPLHLAVEHAHAGIVQRLVAAGADPEASNASGETPLGLAMAAAHPECLRWLRWDGWSLPLRPLRGEDLPAAAACGDAEAVQKLLELGLPMDSRGTQGANALIQACGHGHLALATTLLEQGADPALATPGGATPLVAAINMQQTEVIQLLLERGVQVDQRLPGGITALMVAAAKGRVEEARALLAHGADINAVDEHASTCLHAAARYAFASHDSLRARRLLDLLLEYGAHVNHVDREGMTPLLLLLGAHARPGTGCDATHLGALLPVLLDTGARHDHADQRGVTALHACAMHALLAPARLLLARGADRTAVDGMDRRPTDLARQLGYIDLAAELDERARNIPGARQTLRTRVDPND